MKTENKFNTLKIKKARLVNEFDYLLQEYREYQAYFKRTKSPKDAEYFFRSIKYAKWCQMWPDWQFDDGFETLAMRMSKNRVKRNALVEKIKLIKNEMAEYCRNINLDIV